MEKNTLVELSFGEWLKRRRNTLGLTQEQLALQLNCSTSALRKMEAEERRPSAQIVEQLADIFHIPPNEQTKFLRFARGDWTSAPFESTEEAPWLAAAKSPRSNLPATTSSLVGREKEIKDVSAYLRERDIRLVTLMGPPGIGKTRLSIEVAREALNDFPDGVFFVSLAPLEDPSLLAPTMAQILGLVETRHKSSLELLKDGIADKHMLLVLDNLEHVIEAIAPIVAELLVSCSRLKILMTSREALRVPGEWLYPVPTLNTPLYNEVHALQKEDLSEFAALTLFAERARAVRPDFALNADNVRTVASICAQLDGLPLAIELIAARMRLMSPESLLARLNDQFILYADGMRALSTRQKTLNNAIAWSYNLLSPEEQKLFAYLSVFSGGFRLDAAEAIFSQRFTGKPLTDLITSLLDKSLLQRSLDVHDEVRFTMLVTIQRFALEHLRQMDEAAQVRNWHLHYFLDLAWQADKEIHGPNSVQWLDRLESDHDNYRAALEWCIAKGHTEPALHLIGIFSGIGKLWSVRNYFSESRQWFDKVRALSDVSQYPVAYAIALNGMSFNAALQGDDSAALHLAEESQRICQSLGSDGEMALGGALFAIGLAEFWTPGNLARGRSCYEQAAAIYQVHGDDWERAFASFRMATLANKLGNHEKAQILLENSLVTFEALQDAFMLGRAYVELGFTHKHLGDYERARRLLEQTLIYDRRLRFPHAICSTLTSLGSVCRLQNDYDQAEAYLEEALHISREFSLSDKGSLFYLGCIMLHQENYPQAEKHFYHYLKASLKINARVNIGEGLLGLVAIAAGLKQYARAAVLTGAAQVVHEAVSYKMPPNDLIEIDPLLQQARHQLGDRKFEMLAAEGRAMTMEQAIDYALEIQK